MSDRLTDREMEVWLLIANGYKDKDIARKLYIEARSVGWHVENLRRKIRPRATRVELAIAYWVHIQGVVFPKGARVVKIGGRPC